MEQKQEKMVWKFPNFPPKPFLYESKPSLLDEADPRSALNKSPIRGFFNLTLIFLVIFFLTQPVVNFIDHGYFLDPLLYHSFKVDFLFCLFTWPLFYAWSFTSFFLQKLIVIGLPSTIAIIIQHLTQSGLFIYSIYIVLSNNWCSTHAAYVILHACVHFMKMHSYITVNRDMKEQYQEALKQGRRPASNYPNNVTIKDFNLFMITPWLVYANYPRRDKINWYYVIKKMVITAGLFLIIYLVHGEFIQPWILSVNEVSLVQMILRLMLPSTAFIILGFYLVFQNMCNFFAEISYLDHRQFYQDWWNSHTFQEFNRKWNKPVHNFLYRHCYLQLIIKWKTSKFKAQIFTFFFSACLHELLLAVIFRIVRPIFLGFILSQVPLIMFTKWMQRSRSGLYLFWFGIIFGPTLILCSYLRVDQKVSNMFSRQ